MTLREQAIQAISDRLAAEFLPGEDMFFEAALSLDGLLAWLQSDLGVPLSLVTGVELVSMLAYRGEGT